MARDDVLDRDGDAVERPPVHTAFQIPVDAAGGVHGRLCEALLVYAELKIEIVRPAVGLLDQFHGGYAPGPQRRAGFRNRPEFAHRCWPRYFCAARTTWL